MIEIPKPSKPAGEDKAPRWFHVAVALSMLLSAGAALVSALKTSATMQALVEQNARLVKAGSTPILQYYAANINASDKSELQLAVENVGTGPARVVWLEMRYDGKPLKSSHALPAEVARTQQLSVPKDAHVYTRSGSIAGDVLTAGRRQMLFSWRGEDVQDKQVEALYKAVDRERSKLSVAGCYCSVFDECWETNFGPDLPKPVQRCERKGHVSVNGG
ncbi:hypothetical protein ACS5PK_12325 [Roseateles sp. DB2]|uniref:hypothetical protein n=1 Tax=Roseateles sp. DB2 TaxID=3453717 RepID=UPI003EEF6ECC